MHISENVCKYSSNPTAQEQRERLQGSQQESGLIKMCLTITKMNVASHLVGGVGLLSNIFLNYHCFWRFFSYNKVFWFFLTFYTNFLKTFKNFWSYNA